MFGVSGRVILLAKAWDGGAWGYQEPPAMAGVAPPEMPAMAGVAPPTVMHSPPVQDRASPGKGLDFRVCWDFH